MKISLKTGLMRLAACAAACALTLTGAQAVNVRLDGDALPDAFIENGRTYVPLRAFFERLGWTVEWDEATRSALVADGSGVWRAAEGGYGLTGARAVSADTENRLREGRFYLPVRAAAAAADARVRYEHGEVTVETGGEAYTDEDLLWLARIIEAEAGGEPMEGKIAVGNTILNRVASDEYPDTIYEVVFDTNWGTQYTPTKNGTIYNEPSEDSCEAALRCLNGESVVGECLFFLNPRIAKSFWIVENRAFCRSIGGHDFYY